MNRVILNAIFPGEPVTWKRAGGSGRRRFTPKFMRNAQAKLRRQLKMIAPTLKCDEGSRFGTQMVFRITRAGDGDNFEKLVWDAFNGVIWQTDEQIDEWQGKKKIVDPAFDPPGIHLIVYVIE